MSLTAPLQSLLAYLQKDGQNHPYHEFLNSNDTWLPHLVLSSFGEASQRHDWIHLRTLRKIKVFSSFGEESSNRIKWSLDRCSQDGSRPYHIEVSMMRRLLSDEQRILVSITDSSVGNVEPVHLYDVWIGSEFDQTLQSRLTKDDVVILPDHDGGIELWFVSGGFPHRAWYRIVLTSHGELQAPRFHPGGVYFGFPRTDTNSFYETTLKDVAFMIRITDDVSVEVSRLVLSCALPAETTEGQQWTVEPRVFGPFQFPFSVACILEAKLEHDLISMIAIRNEKPAAAILWRQPLESPLSGRPDIDMEWELHSLTDD